ncbi:MAG: DNA mismatch repair protein MutS [Pseudanabaenaceae cyanobacterium]
MAELAIALASIQRADLTPMLQHFAAMKDRYPQALLLYRLGDFYETFFEDAQILSRELELVLTGKDGGKNVGRVAMAGVPHHALERYARQLVAKGYAVAVCEQMEPAAAAQGLVRREVTRVITPGTALEEGLLVAKQNNYLMAIVPAGGLAWADVSTGEFFATQVPAGEAVWQELYRWQPAEVLYPTEGPGERPAGLPDGFCYTPRSPGIFALAEAQQRLLETFAVRSLEGFGLADWPLAIRAAGAIVAYLQETQPGGMAPLLPPKMQYPGDYLVLDRATQQNLEILQTVREGATAGSLLRAVDRTVTAMGGRLLRRWLVQPLMDLAAIAARADTVAELVADGLLRAELPKALGEVRDLERLAGRVGNSTAGARDLVALASSLSRLPAIARLVSQAQSSYLRALQDVPPELLALAQKLQRWLVENPPLTLMEGGLIQPGASAELDRLRHQAEEDVAWLAQLEKTERQRTGIATLKVGYTKAFGYYLSISRGKSDQAPPEYIRKQTLTTEERFITPELKERETRILHAREEQNLLEYQLFDQLRAEAATHVATIRAIAARLAAADVLAGWADIAVRYQYCRPVLTLDRRLEVVGGRHPVTEQTLPAGFFVPNDVALGSPDHPDLMVLTGPNMSGKSVYLRQLGLIQILAQAGCFVPATRATLGLCDRIFTRVGAVDDLATGQSTFMVEMNETANILNHATDRSLVLLDEIGRGTSTFDGMAIAWAVAEYLAETVKARSIFATHYHELNELAGILPNVANFQVAVKELPDEIVFLHQVQPGGADRSYGIEVARLAGLPAAVIGRSRELLSTIAKNSRIATGLRKGARKAEEAPPPDQLGLFAP